MAVYRKLKNNENPITIVSFSRYKNAGMIIHVKPNIRVPMYMLPKKIIIEKPDITKVLGGGKIKKTVVETPKVTDIEPSDLMEEV